MPVPVPAELPPVEPVEEPPVAGLLPVPAVPVGEPVGEPPVAGLLPVDVPVPVPAGA